PGGELHVVALLRADQRQDVDHAGLGVGVRGVARPIHERHGGEVVDLGDLVGVGRVVDADGRDVVGGAAADGERVGDVLGGGAVELDGHGHAPRSVRLGPTVTLCRLGPTV